MENSQKNESAMLKSLNFRYATKKFDSAKKVSEKDFDELLEALRLSASSFGLQPWKFVVVRNKELRNELRKHAWNQPQITDASHLIVLCAVKDINEDYVKRYIKSISKIRSIPVESLKNFEDIMVGFIKKHTEDSLSTWASNQVYLALGFLLFACAQKGIDSCPMEGFDRKKFDEVLNLDSRELQSVVLCTIGYRSKDDATANYPKVRFGREEIISFKE